MAQQERQQAKPFGTGRTVVAVAGTLAGLSLGFAVIMTMLYVDRASDPVPTDPDAPTPEERLAELRAAEHEALTTYGWIDRDKGVARIPIDRAMNLLAAEYAAAPATQPATSTASETGRRTSSDAEGRVR